MGRKSGGEDASEIPYSMIPGPQATYRCCIYKEREIIRQRVRLAEGKCPTGQGHLQCGAGHQRGL